MLEGHPCKIYGFSMHFFGVAKSNDINNLDQSQLFKVILNGTAPSCPFRVNRVHYKHMYYINIPPMGYTPNWDTFVKTFTFPNDDK